MSSKPKLHIHERRFEAMSLLKLGFSVSIVSKCSKLPISFVRAMHKSLYLEASRSGPLKEINGILKNMRKMIQAAMILKNYVAIGENVYKEVDLQALFKAYQLYEECFYRTGLDKDNLWEIISLNHAWQLCRGLISREVKLKICANGCSYIETTSQSLRLECQLCKLSSKEQSRITRDAKNIERKKRKLARLKRAKI